MKREHNQVIKFQKKWGIQKQDEHDIYEPKMKEKEDFEGEQELEQAGRIEEAAAVFSKEGMGFFANLMRDTIREEIEKVLPQVAQEMKPLIREMVQREIETAFLAMIRGLRSGLPHFGEKPHIAAQPEPVQEEPAPAGTTEPVQEEPAPVETPEPKAEAEQEDFPNLERKSRPSKYDWEQITQTVAEFLQDQGDPVFGVPAERIIRHLIEKKLVDAKVMESSANRNYVLKEVMKARPDITKIKRGRYTIRQH